MDSRKVAIPRLERAQPERKATAPKSRAQTACTQCRKRKVRCTGETPRCKHCIEQDVECVYPRARQDRLRAATEQNQQLVNLLKDLSTRVDDADRLRIDEVLASQVNDVGDHSDISLGKRSREDASRESTAEEVEVSGSVGSNEDASLLDEDLLRSHESRATGYIGQNSEVQWLKSLKTQLGDGEQQPSHRHGPPGDSGAAQKKRVDAENERAKGPIDPLHVTEATFYLDEEDLNLDIGVNPKDLPAMPIAEKLISYYFQTVHTSFPVIAESFRSQLNNYLTSVSRGVSVQPPTKWLALMNMVFAIGARYADLTHQDWRAHDCDHKVYMSRAVRLLVVDEAVMFIGNPDMALIQATALLSFYYLIIGHVSKAWAMIGISSRIGLGVGLHLRNTVPSSPWERKESLIRIWWGIHSIECHLSSVTGRPCVIANEECTVPLPESPADPEPSDNVRRGSIYVSRSESVSYSESSSNLDPDTLDLGIRTTLLRARIGIALVTQKALAQLYFPRAAATSWAHIQQIIPDLVEEIDQWALTALPEGLSFRMVDSYSMHDMPSTEHWLLRREQLLLAFSYNSTKIIITRPCLCRLDRRIQKQSSDSALVNQRTAEACVKAAIDLTSLLPDDATAYYIYVNGPWWSIIHYIMQAMAVLLLELAHGERHSSRGGDDIPSHIKKLVKWLRCMRGNQPVAERAYTVAMGIIKSVRKQAQAEIDAILAEEEKADTADREREAWQEQEQSRFNLDPLLQDLDVDTTYDDTPMANYMADSMQFSSATFDPALYTEDLHMSYPEVSMANTYGLPFSSTFDQTNPFLNEEAWSTYPPVTSDYDST
ncbi:hypothetical protein K491DRAFT_718355 [Lophiostoma macrostomum CBS 122681]|uniref:Zn(2)-C6 fungal-type domain-containing protein n=1 Tax=Lophiostoma macrostomum CBS 122681 TaxID=1314788 RepID=A0A6A6T2I4_9PLEO|nr:hypothetical protein K491DRAFT_718355 [Lophiostoma macrostomum CBS 122681]